MATGPGFVHTKKLEAFSKQEWIFLCRIYNTQLSAAAAFGA